jgi:two-component system OmpR family response regulator
VPAPTTSGERSRKILIIDDHADSARSLAEFMARAGHSVLTAANGELGVDLAAEFKPDAVIIDIGLPGIDGFEVGRLLCQQPFNPLMIAVSGYSLKKFRELEAYSVFRHYLLKPVNPQGLLHIIEKTLDDSERA